jgi:probable HAF family extracellular repeat protein
MSSQKTCLIAIVLFATLAAPAGLAAQEENGQKEYKKAKPQRYTLINLGTFGGPASTFNFTAGFLNSRGIAVGAAETPIPIPPHFNPFPCGPGTFIYHAFEWQNGVVTDLDTLPGGNCSNAIWINAAGEIAGNSENGEIDPLTGIRELRAVVWKNDENEGDKHSDDNHGNAGIKDLGTLGGNHSGAAAINDRGQIVGFALNGVPDPFSIFDAFFLAPDSQCPSCGTQTRAFLWQDGAMQDLGTLGGPDASANFVNKRGQVAGVSYTNSMPNPVTQLPTVDPFLWEDGRMVDLGTLGGIFGFANGLNRRGQVIGVSSVADDPAACFTGSGGCHPFLWDRGKLVDMYTDGIGGIFQFANVINDRGEIAGQAAFPNGASDAALWRNGVVTDLGVLDGDCVSVAWSINSRGQVGGVSVSCDGNTWRAFLWENGSMVDLNTLIPANSGLTLVYALGINDRGEIAGLGVPPGVPTADSETLGHAFVLIPCDEGHAKAEGCQGVQKTSVAAENHPASLNQSPMTQTHRRQAAAEIMARMHARLAHYQHGALGAYQPK